MHVAILTGGTSSEREIALRSAENVEKILQDLHNLEVFRLPEELPRFLEAREKFSVAIPMLHGRGGEDGTAQGLLEMIGLPYLFSGVRAQAIAMDKELTKTAVGRLGVKGPNSAVVRRGESLQFTKPVVVKPVDGGSSVGTTLVRSGEKLAAAFARAFETSGRVMVEEYIEGDEFTVGMIEEQGKTVALPVIQIKPRGEFFDYSAKYDAGELAEEICPAAIAASLSVELQRLAALAHAALGCRHLSRSDFIVDRNGAPYFLELNTIPGMTATSLVPKMVAASGRSLADLFDAWLAAPVRRGDSCGIL